MQSGLSSAPQHRWRTQAINKLSRLLVLAALPAFAGLAGATTPDASQAAVRKTEPVIEMVKSAISGSAARLARIPDINHLASHSVLIQDAASGETLFARNAAMVTPIASITKLMTAMVVLDRGLDMHERLTISDEDMDSLKFTRSRLKPGTVLTREELILLALMSSENRAATALGRNYPGGMPAFVAAMNAKARSLGMADSRFHDPSGLSPQNVSSAPDLARLVKAAHAYAVIREYSTRDRHQVTVQGRLLNYMNTNALIRAGDWNIGLQKTGFINEAGRCLVMRASIASKDLVLVLLDSVGRNARITDAKLIRQWVEATRLGGTQNAAARPKLVTARAG
jgi:serine-type D-Ala-D-Ala endopeptidase (penicillin-binding protein 7)